MEEPKLRQIVPTNPLNLQQGTSSNKEPKAYPHASVGEPRQERNTSNEAGKQIDPEGSTYVETRKKEKRSKEHPGKQQKEDTQRDQNFVRGLPMICRAAQPTIGDVRTSNNSRVGVGRERQALIKTSISWAPALFLRIIVETFFLHPKQMYTCTLVCLIYDPRQNVAYRVI